ncbi:M16 family metallopeptidase [Cloacibacterium sp.]|uniref:M16 family metallopeptidase n=1 Tax=Cloacibacterium sp. TaxID=1913682 RepID=UPI0035B0FAA3
MKKLSYIAAAFLISGMLSAQKLDLNAMPKPGPTPIINIAKPKTFTLSNGLQVLVVENNKLPRVSVNLSMDRPPIYEGDIAGVTSIMADQIGKGSKTISKDDFNKKVDYLGANLRFSSGGAFANSLSKYFPQVLNLMADAIINPNFDAKELQDDKDRILEGLKADEKNAQSIANRVNNALIYGKNTARGEFETEESIKKISLADVQNSYKKYYAPDNAYLVIVGDVKYSTVKSLVTKAFSTWKKSNTKFAALEPVSNVSTTEINVVDVPTAVQSIVNVGNVNTLKMTDANYFPGMIANYILGGGAEARLFMNLREKNGFTYGAYSSLSASKYSPEFSADASVRNEVTDKAVKEFMTEINGISTVKPEELANAKAKMKGSFIMSLEKPETIARFALNQKVNNLPADFYSNYLKSIDQVTEADATKAVNATIFPQQTRIFIAGKASDIAEGLEKLGYPVKYFDKYANPTSKPTAKQVDANVTVSSIADKYIAAIGGKENAAKFNTLNSDATAKIQGMELSFKTIQGKGGKFFMDMGMAGNSMQKIAFDGTKGYMIAQGQKMDLPADMASKFAKKTEIFPELSFGKSADYKLIGIEKVNGEDVYVIKDADTTYYYSVKTGLKVGEIQKQKMGPQEMEVPTYYSDYKDVNGVKLPYTIKQTMMGQEIEMKVNSYSVNQAKDEDFK